MSVLIRGMEMPKSCWQCFARTDVNIGVGIADGCNLIKAMISAPDERLPDCPLVEIPPHGRLIDADAMRESLADLMKFPSNLVNGQWIVNTIREQHTIIPAEEGDNG